MPTGAQAASDTPVRPRRRTTSFVTSLSNRQYHQHHNNNNSNSSLSVVIFVLVVSSLLCLCGAQDQNEAQPLLKFRDSLLESNNNLDRLANWKPSTPPCTGNRANWACVLCFNGNVFGLQMENMNLKGEINIDALTPLRSFRSLSLMGNNFEGAMPDWRKLGYLKSLYMSNNQFTGQIPEDAFKGMTSLKKLHFANNKLSGHIPTSLESPKLIELMLENNQFTGSIPMISSENLKVLNVSNNQLEGPIPKGLSKMDVSSFSGNKALCGDPVESSCYPAKKMGKNLAIVIAVIVVLVIIIILIVCRKGGSETEQQGRAMSSSDIEELGSNVAEVGAVTPVSKGKAKRKPQQQQQASGGGSTGKLSFVNEDRQRFELQDLMRASAEVLGSGNFGASYKAVLVDGAALVVKRFKQMNTIAKEDFFEHMRRLGRLQHPNLLPLVAYLYRKEEKLLVFDFAQNGSLASQLHGKPKGFGWETRLNIIKGVGKGLVYLQRELPSLTLSHGHLKASNVVLDKDFNPLLMDYALAPVVNSGNVSQVLLAYKSPEYVKHGLVSKKTDVWCFGLLLLEILTGKYVAHGSDQVDLSGYINSIVGEGVSAKAFDKNMDTSCMADMEKLLQIAITCCEEDPDKRLDLEETVRQIEQVNHQDS